MEPKSLTTHSMKIYFYTFISVVILSITIVSTLLLISYLTFGNRNIDILYENIFKISNSFIYGCDNMMGTTLRYSLNTLLGIPSCKEIHAIYYEFLDRLKNMILTCIVILWYPTYNYWISKV